MAKLSILLLLGILFGISVHCRVPGSDPTGDTQEGAHSPQGVTTLGRSDIGGDFTLTISAGPGSSRGKKWTLSENLRDVNLVFFGYMSCPDYCPMTLTKFKKLNAILGEGMNRVQFVFVSVDAERDRVDQLQSYVQFFVHNGVGLTGSPEEVSQVATQYKAKYSRTGDSIDHTTSIYAVDRSLKVRYVFAHSDPPEKLAEILRLLL